MKNSTAFDMREEKKDQDRDQRVFENVEASTLITSQFKCLLSFTEIQSKNCRE